MLFVRTAVLHLKLAGRLFVGWTDRRALLLRAAMGLAGLGQSHLPVAHRLCTNVHRKFSDYGQVVTKISVTWRTLIFG